MPRRYKTLASAPHEPRRGYGPNSRLPHEDVRKKRQHQQVACDACRAKKEACDGERPTCTPCLYRKSQCVYRVVRNVRYAEAVEAERRKLDNLQQKLGTQNELIQVLRRLPEDAAFDTLRRLRSSSDLSGVLSPIKGSMHSRRQPSILRAARSICPPTQSEIEFELMVLHQPAYPKMAPIDISFLRKFLEPSVPRVDAQTDGAPWKPKIIQAAQPFALKASSVSGPSAPQPLCDNRLHRIQISYWSRVPITNEYAATVISFYLETDHAIMGLFDADLFIEDLVERRLRFCSPFLVSALLYLACQAYAAIDVRASILSQAFFKDAEVLRAGECASDSITSVAALFIFGIGCIFHGRDSTAQEVSKSGRRMAERLGLFGIPKDDPLASSFRNMSPDSVRMTSHVAWGAYNWLTVLVLYYHEQPILHTPALPVPGENCGRDLWPSHCLPGYMGPTFPMACKLWAIAQEVAVVYVPHSDGPISYSVPLAFAEAKYQKLLSWMDSVKADMVRGDHSPAHVVMFHIWFHVIVVNIFNPFVHEPSAYRMRSFTSPDSFPNQIYTATINQLKQLTFWYHSRYREARFTALFNTGLVMLSNALLNGMNDANWREFFLLCVRCWEDLYICYPIFHDIAQGFLTMALRNNLISGLEAENIMERLRRRGRHHDTADGATVTFISDFKLAMTSPEEAKIDVMARKFNDLVISEQFKPEEIGSQGDESGSSSVTT